jgi:hypothetical protein
MNVKVLLAEAADLGMVVDNLIFYSEALNGYSIKPLRAKAD